MMPKRAKSEDAGIHQQTPGAIPRFLTQSFEVLLATQEMLWGLIRERPPAPKIIPGRPIFSDLAKAGITNLLEAQSVMVAFARRQNHILMGTLNRGETEPLQWMRRSVDALLEFHESVLKSASRNSEIWWKGGASFPAGSLMRESLQALIDMQERLLEPKPSGVKSVSGTSPAAGFGSFALQFADSLIDMESQLLSLGIRQFESGASAARRVVNGIRLPAMEVSDLGMGMEIAMLHTSPIYWGIGIPPGNGSGVILIPGFLGTDLYLFELFSWLARIGYRPYYSGIGLNSNCPNLIIQNRLNSTIDRAVRETGGRVHLIGHSLGGIIGRSLARSRPDDIASVITLASPFRGAVKHTTVLRASEFVRKHVLLKQVPESLPECYTGNCSCDFMDFLRRNVPAHISQTAIYTKTDRVVRWRYCVTGKCDLDFEVPGTHIGLVFNPFAFDIIARRLAATDTRPGKRAHLSNPAKRKRPPQTTNNEIVAGLKKGTDGYEPSSRIAG
jgi:triacylglycerol lipase